MSLFNALTSPAAVEREFRSHTALVVRVVAFLVVWAIATGYMATRLKIGWVPNNEGTLGLSAERVLQGQLPHRDFDDYSGGLTFVHALAFRILGISSATMRTVLFLFFLMWVPAVFYIASHFGSALSASAVTLLAVAWSTPNYPGPMPSWYGLFFATWGVAAVLRYLNVGSARWLFAAGLCGGLSALAKVTAAYYVAAVLLFLIFRQACVAGSTNRRASTFARLYVTAITICLAAFLILLFSLIRTVPGTSGLVYFFLPTFSLVVFMMSRELAAAGLTDRERFLALGRQCAPFAFGVAVPLFVFSIPYVQARALHELLQGLLATPTRAIQFASFTPLSPITMVSMIPFVVSLLVAHECRGAGRVICGVAVALYGVAVLFFANTSTPAYYLGWCPLGTSIPLLIVAGVVMLSASRNLEKPHTLRQQQVMLLLSVTSLGSLIQFPFAAPIYFFYIAPLAILSLMALCTLISKPPKVVCGILIGIYLAFPNLPVTSYQMGISHSRDGQVKQLNVARAGGLRVDPTDAVQYNELIPLIQSHATGKFIYAAPDCPEVYFLSGFQSPSRHYFDFADDSQNRTNRILQEVENLNLNVIVICRRTESGEPMRPDLQKALKQRYIHSATVGSFQIRWKE
jgi:hypothetical protein